MNRYKLLRYGILKSLCWGKKRKHYQKKYQKLLDGLSSFLGNEIIVKHSNIEDELIGFDKIKGLEIKIRGNNNKIVIADDVVFQNCQINVVADNSLIEIGKKTILKNTSIFIIAGTKQHLSIGQKVYINEAKIVLEEISECFIQDECLFGKGIHIRTSDGHSLLDKQTGDILNPVVKPIIIGKRCWLAHNVTILKNVQLAEGTVVANGSIVTKSFNEPNIVIGGVPARILKHNILWNRKSPFLLGYDYGTD